MTVPCVRVEREAGERTRKRLADRDLIDEARRITVADGSLYIPVRDPGAVPEDLQVVHREVDARETQTMPADLLEFAPSYERLGDVAIVDEDDPDRARELADAIVASDIPIRSVVNRASKIQGTERVREWEVLAVDETAAESDGSSPSVESGWEPTETVHREFGCEFHLDLATVYFSPRLATERHRVAEGVGPDERVFDMFAGVGPYAIPIAKRGTTVVATDVNESAVRYLRENARRNDVEDRITAINADVRTLVDSSGPPDDETAGKTTAAAGDYRDWADRIVMNLPHSADEFLETAVAIAGGDCLVHYYDIQNEDDPYGPGERAIRDAAESEYEVTVENRRTVRSYSPHELNVVLDVRLRR